MPMAPIQWTRRILELIVERLPNTWLPLDEAASIVFFEVDDSVE